MIRSPVALAAVIGIAGLLHRDGLARVTRQAVTCRAIRLDAASTGIRRGGRVQLTVLLHLHLRVVALPAAIHRSSGGTRREARRHQRAVARDHPGRQAVQRTRDCGPVIAFTAFSRQRARYYGETMMMKAFLDAGIST